jgi:hypothetical protein
MPTGPLALTRLALTRLLLLALGGCGDDATAHDAMAAGAGSAGDAAPHAPANGMTSTGDPTGSTNGEAQMVSAEPQPGQGEDGSGQTTSIGPQATPCDEARCAEAARELLASLQEPGMRPGFQQGAPACFTRPQGFGAVGTGPLCLCLLGAAGPATVSCLVYGRGGECLLEGSELPACQPDDPDSCDAFCEDYDALVLDDLERTFDTELLHSACIEDSCHHVARIDDSCVADFVPRVPPREYDCALGGEAILERHLAGQAPPPPPDCNVDEMEPDPSSPSAPAGCGVPTETP